MPTKAINKIVRGVPIGCRFGRLVVIGFNKEETPKGRHTMAHCVCDCGKATSVWPASLRNGTTKSCGCLRMEGPKVVTHGDTRKGAISPEYRAYTAMLARCRNPNVKAYKYYGGRGITVCERWMGSFENFLADMGRRPSVEHSLDRFPNQNGNYELDNCRWANPIEQGQNKRSTVMLTHNGITQCLSDWSRQTGIGVGRISARLRYGWPIEKVLTPGNARYGSHFVQAEPPPMAPIPPQEQDGW